VAAQRQVQIWIKDTRRSSIGRLSKQAMHKMYRQQISDKCYDPVFRRVAPVNPSGKARNEVSYNTHTPVYVIHVKPIDKERSIRNMSEGRTKGRRREKWMQA
jgi:hypothetical protein